MGRPKGSKNKPKITTNESINNGVADAIIEENTNNKSIQQDFSFEEFARSAAASNPAINQLIDSGIFSPYLLNNLLKWSEGYPCEYTRDEVVKLIKDPVKNEKAIRQMHLYFYHNNLFYKRIIEYFASMLTFKHWEKPLLLYDDEIETSAFKKSYAKVKDFFNKFNVDEEFRYVTETVLGDDVGYYYIIEDKNEINLFKLPSDWCMITGKQNHTHTFQFNMVYFLRYGVQKIENYPQEFQDEWERLMGLEDQNAIKKEPFLWYEVKPENSYVFKFNNLLSTVICPFMGLFLDLLQIVEYKNLIKSKAQLEATQIIFQKIPLNTDKGAKNPYMINAKDAGKFHKALKTSLPEGGEGLFRAVTSPCDINSVNLNKSDNKDNLVGKAESDFYNSTGTSQLLFNSENTTGMALLKAINVDESFLFHLLRQYERFLTREINKRTNRIRFKVNMPNLTYYNTKDELTAQLGAGQYGIPNKSLILNAAGINQIDASTMTKFESFLGFDKDWIPLLNSHSTNGADINNKGGRPKGEVVSDSTEVTIDNDSNISRGTGKSY